jgi:hypothetical protein
MRALLALGAIAIASQAPTAVTGGVTNVTRTGATIHSRFDPKGRSDANLIWQYGPTRAYGSVAGGFGGFSTKPRSATAQLSDLAPGTLYHYRFTVTTGAGKGVGADRTFKTRGDPASNVTPVSGTVLVRLPGSATFVPLTATQQIRMGSIVDTREGTVRICPPNGPQTSSHCANFHDGEFRLRQATGLIIELRLVGGDFSVCTKARTAAAKLPTTSVRHLWGEGHGRFRTVGRYSSAAIRGTTWLTDDRCDGTLTRVTKGSVKVRDFTRKRSLVVRAGHRYLARAR